MSLITGIGGIHFNIGIYGGNIRDSAILLDQLKSENMVNVDSINYKGGIEDKYFWKIVDMNISKSGMTYLIPQNIRKIKILVK